ncbi:hypothetical protein [Planobispora rosea]|uniref:hypothetical protein n=1 Tax=Planobispora rosea TaxID=35762 RepID=UPI00159F1132|nr:hypothetical protein [Planobispora rosea]
MLLALAQDEARISYGDRRPYTVPETLEGLGRPTGGVVELPLHLDETPMNPAIS